VDGVAGLLVGWTARGEDSGVALGAGALPFRVRPLRADVALDTDTFVLATEKDPISGEETRTILSHTFSTVPATPPYLREPLTTTGVPTLSGLAGEAAGGGGVDIVRDVLCVTLSRARREDKRSPPLRKNIFFSSSPATPSSADGPFDPSRKDHVVPTIAVVGSLVM